MSGLLIFLGCHLGLAAALLPSLGEDAVRNTGILASFLVLSVLNFWIWLVPMNRVKDVRPPRPRPALGLVITSLVFQLQEVGYRHLGAGRLRAAAVNRARRLRKLGNTPPPFPNGWLVSKYFLRRIIFSFYPPVTRFVLLESREVGRGEVRQVEALGLNLAVFRGSESGAVFVTDAYCPHLGANIAVGGRSVIHVETTLALPVLFSAVKRLIGEVLQSRRRPLLGPFPG